MADNIQKEGMLKVGTTLVNGKYRIDQYLASGGFGNTYIATDTAFDEKVAIKELFIKGICGRDTDSKDISVSLQENQRTFTAQQEKFRKEARRLRKLTNPHIVRVHDLFDENGTSYYVMDFVEGESLSARMKRTGKAMNESEVMLILPQVLDALECVHNEGIWHLDLKPANIMIDARGNVQLIDFGASKQLRNNNGDSLSTSSAMAYTPGYAPSEQMEQNIEKFGPWTDLYALGATLFNLLTKQQPPSPSDIDEDSRSALKMPTSISRKTEKLIFWLMKPNRTMRPKSVMDVKQFLAETVKDTHHISVERIQEENQEPDTIVKHKKPVVTETEPFMEEATGDKGKIKIITIVAAAIVCIGGGIYALNNMGTQDISTDVAAVTIKNVADTVVVMPNGTEYAFTGELVDTIGALPNGKGIAKYPKTKTEGAKTYEGNFVNGICEDNTGEATMTFENGDRYTGTFTNGFFDKGKYITAEDNYYFEGTFKDGQPYNGKWYAPDGTPDSDVVNGK